MVGVVFGIFVLIVVMCDRYMLCGLVLMMWLKIILLICLGLMLVWLSVVLVIVVVKLIGGVFVSDLLNVLMVVCVLDRIMILDMCFFFDLVLRY